MSIVDRNRILRKAIFFFLTTTIIKILMDALTHIIVVHIFIITFTFC